MSVWPSLPKDDFAPARSRPSFRYWLPDSSVNSSIVAANINSAASIGAGGVEFIGFYQYDWAKYGFGTPAFIDVFTRALQAHKEAGLGQGVPASVDDDGLQWDLYPVTSLLSASTSLNGTIPGWGQGKLIALLSAEMVSSENVTEASPVFSLPMSYTKLVVQSGSIVDLTSQVSESGQVSLSAATSPSGTETWTFAIYERKTLKKNLLFPVTASDTIFDNGLFTVDHFSRRGAKTIIKFWQEHMLHGEIVDLLKEVGGYGWEDSPELLSNITWSPGLPAAFIFLMWGNNNLVQTAIGRPGLFRVVEETPSSTTGYINDYRATLQVLYKEYLDTLRDWLHSIGLSFRTQISYNLPMDMAANIPWADAPEAESLGFEDDIDSYRQYTGPAILSGKHIISNELGAVTYNAYQYPVTELLYSANVAFAGGINKMVIHGAQWVQQAGTPRVDRAIYRNTTWSGLGFPALYNGTDLTSSDPMTHERGRVLLHLPHIGQPQAAVTNGTLAAEGPAIKALVVPGKSSITEDVIDNLIQYANAGLPIVVAAKEGGVAAKLQSLGVSPRVKDLAAGLDYIFVRGDLKATYGSLIINASGIPYRFNAWTGRTQAILHYTHQTKDSAITIPLALNANQTQLIAISKRRLNDVPTPDYHITELPEAVVGYEYIKGKGISAQVIKLDRSILSDIPPAFDLQRWNLTAEHWEAPTDLGDAAVIARKRNTTHALTAPLLSRGTLDAQLHNPSGVGYYHTQFTWPSGGRDKKATSAYLAFTRVLNTLRVEVNGQRLGPVDLNNTRLDIGDYLRPGQNDVVVVVPTTMWNYLRSILPNIRNAGDLPSVDGGRQQLIPGPSENGLVGTVTITPYREVAVKA
ncbi:hypothetical protein BJX65DRAFT_322380 [Aspergillus insuetus]